MKTTLLKKKRYVLTTVAFVLASFTQLALQTNPAHAATLTNAFVRFDRIMQGTQTTGTVCAKPVTTGVESTIAVTFPTGYVLGTAANFTTNTTNLSWPSGGTAWITVGSTATSVSGQLVTWSSGDLTVGTLYCFNWTTAAAVTTPSSASNNQVGTVATNLDSAQFTSSTITNDQIAITASVPQSFSFALSANTDTLPTLSTSVVTVSPTPRTATVNTNAKAGWSVWASDNAPSGIHSNSANYTISGTTPGTNSTLSAGTEGYNLGVTSAQTGGTGTITVAAPFVGGSTGKGGGIDTTLRTVASSGGTANNAVLTLTNNIAISAITPAATDYSDAEFITAAGLF